MINNQDSETYRDDRESLPMKLFSAFSGQLGVFILATTSTVVIARTLGPAGKGLFSLTVLLASVIVLIGHGSISLVNAHFSGRNPKYVPFLAGNSLFIAFAWGGLLTLLGFMFGDELQSRFLQSIPQKLFDMALLAIIPLLLLEYANGLVIGLDRIRWFNFTLVVKEGLILTGIFLLLKSEVTSVMSMVAVWILAGVLTAIIQNVFALIKIRWKFTISPNIFLRTTNYSTPWHIANVTSFLKDKFDLFVIAFFLQPSEVGYYSIAMAMIMALWYLPSAIAQVLLPHISWRSDEAGNKLTPRLCRVGFAISIVCAVAMAIFGSLVIRLLAGPEYLPAYPALLLLLPGGVIYTLAKMLAGDLAGRGLPRYAMIISSVALVINVVLNLLFIPKFGISGAAIASSLSHALSGLLFLHFFLVVSGASLRETVLLTSDDLRTIFRVFGRKGRD